jgi:hypothetical protein
MELERHVIVLQVYAAVRATASISRSMTVRNDPATLLGPRPMSLERSHGSNCGAVDENAQISAVLGVPGYAPCPRQGICITYSLLLALPRCHLRVGGMLSRYPQQPILVDTMFLIVPFALHHYTYLIEGADFPIGRTYIRNPYGCLSNEIKVP